MEHPPMTTLADEIERLAAKATPGLWEVDSEYDEDALYSGGGGCGSGFKNFFIGTEVNGKWRTLLDTQNSDHKLIEEEYDEDGKTAWDSIGQANAALVIALVNNLPAIVSALRGAEQVREKAAQVAEAVRDDACAFQAERTGCVDEPVWSAVKVKADEIAAAIRDNRT